MNTRDRIAQIHRNPVLRLRHNGVRDPIVQTALERWTSRARSLVPAGTPFMNWATDLANFSRGSEAAAQDPRAGWAWYDTVTPFPGSNVRRILADGAILIEAAATNVLLQSEDVSNGAWSTGAGTAVSGKADPAGGTKGVQVAVGDNAGVGRYQVLMPAKDSVVTAFVKASTPVGANFYSIGGTNLASNATKEVSGAPPASWTRESAPVQQTADGAGYTLIANAQGSPTWGGSDHTHHACDAIYYGIQNEHGDFATSFIRTAGAGATRAADVAALGEIGPQMRLSRWSLNVWPEYAVAVAPATAYVLHLDASHYLALLGSTLRLRAGGVSYDVTGLSYAANDKITISVDFVRFHLSVSINGGAATTIAIEHNWAGAPTSGHLGSDGAAGFFGGAIGRPEGA